MLLKTFSFYESEIPLHACCFLPSKSYIPCSFGPLILIMHRFLGQFAVSRLRCTHSRLQHLSYGNHYSFTTSLFRCHSNIPLACSVSHLLVLFLPFHPLMRHFVLLGWNVSLYFLGSDARRGDGMSTSPWKTLHLCFFFLSFVSLCYGLK